MARLIKISYAGLTLGLGGDASITLTEKYRCAYAYPEFTLGFEVVVRNATRATFLTAEAALIAAFRTPDGDLDVDLGGTNRHSFSHSLGTGFNGRATCEKIPDKVATANSARYRCTVTIQLPADASGRAGRQTSSVSVDAGPNGQRQVTIDGVFTAIAATPNATGHLAAVTSYCNDILGDVGGVYELLSPGGGYRYDDQDKILSFRRVYQEVIYRQSLSGGDHAAIKRPSLSVERVTPPDDSTDNFDTRPLEQFRVSYSAEIDKNETQDLTGLYNQTIRPLMLAEISGLAGSAVVLVRETFVPGPTGNTVSAAMEGVADFGSAFYRATLELQEYIREPKEWQPVWDGDPYSVDEYDVPGLHIRTAIRQLAYRDGRTVDARLGVPNYEAQGFKLIDTKRTKSFLTIGSAGQNIPIVNEVVVYTWRLVRVRTAGATGHDGVTGGGFGGFASGGERPRPL